MFINQKRKMKVVCANSENDTNNICNSNKDLGDETDWKEKKRKRRRT